VVLRPGLTVLVRSAGGGVGSALVPLCKLHDLKVGSTSQAKLDVVTSDGSGGQGATTFHAKVFAKALRPLFSD
jgi:NADPH:quinone reductase-like Zn-dependent oxidoreductase